MVSTMAPTKSLLPIFIAAIALCIGAVQGLNCYKCGQYNDGVGSITPCINHTHMQLKECPSSAEYCIKYVSEGSTVRDCVIRCDEKEAWSTRTYCCKEDGCNSGPTVTSVSATLIGIALVLVLVSHSLRG